MFDRNMNGEMEFSTAKKQSNSKEESHANQVDRLVKVLLSTNHMVMKTSNIKTMSFIKVPQEFKLSLYSQAFIGDINGDQYDDIIFNNVEAK